MGLLDVKTPVCIITLKSGVPYAGAACQLGVLFICNAQCNPLGCKGLDNLGDVAAP